MATKIRLKRIGRRNRPFYRVVVMDSRNRRDGGAIEELGWFNPIDANKSYDLKEDRFMEWLKIGAQPSEAAHGLMKRSGLAHRWHLTQQGLDEKAIEKEMKKWAMNREETKNKRAAARADKKLKEAEVKAQADAEAAAAAEAAAEEEAPAEEEVEAAPEEEAVPEAEELTEVSPEEEGASEKTEAEPEVEEEVETPVEEEAAEESTDEAPEKEPAEEETEAEVSGDDGDAEEEKTEDA